MNRLRVEWVLLFWALPALMLLAGPGFPIPIPLMVATVVITIYLVRNREFANKSFFSRGDLKTFGQSLLWRVPLVSVCLLALTLWLEPDQLFYFPREHPLIWVMVMLLYPVFSAFPQEIIYRAFFFHRYGKLFRSTRLLMAMSAICFAFVHVAYGNVVGPLLTLPAGVLFVTTYSRQRSILLTAVEHGIYGALLFTVGLGKYFFHGHLGGG